MNGVGEQLPLARSSSFCFVAAISPDFVGSTHAGVVDGLATIAHGKHLVLYVWYDNEFGYSNQVIRIVEEIAGARPKMLPERKELAELG